jgi:hypothetical protein
LLRFGALLLLTWIAVDLAAIDTCVLDIDAAAPVDSSTAPVFRSPGGSHVPTGVHHGACVCHSHSVEPTAMVRLAAPAHLIIFVGTLPPDRPHDAPVPLDHPPQLPA